MIAIKLTNGTIETKFATYLPILEVLREIANLIKDGDKVCLLSERLQGFSLIDPVEATVVLEVPGRLLEPLRRGTVAIRLKHGTEYYTCQQIQAMFAPEPETENNDDDA